MVDMFNSWMSFTLAIVIAWAIMSKHVRDGIVVKIGLICLSISFLSAWLLTLQNGYQNSEALEAIHCLIYIGLAICVAGYFLRTRITAKGRRATDWIQK
jgi:hypothetical protein